MLMDRVPSRSRNGSSIACEQRQKGRPGRDSVLIWHSHGPLYSRSPQRGSPACGWLRQDLDQVTEFLLSLIRVADGLRNFGLH